MPIQSTDPAPPDDDSIADALADEVVERILRDHPHASPDFRRRLVGLYLRRATGSIAPQEPATIQEIAEAFGLQPQRVSEIVADARLKLRHNVTLAELYLQLNR